MTRYPIIHIEVVKNGYIVHASPHPPGSGYVSDQYVFRSSCELGEWIKNHAGDFEE